MLLSKKERIDAARAFIQTQSADFKPTFGLVLGTGLSGLVDAIDVHCRIPYTSIPHFPTSTVQSHLGELVLGHIESVPVVALAGRFHYYEGYSMEALTFPIYVLHALGIERLFLSNAAGSVNANHEAGEMVFIQDHINLMPEHPLRGPNENTLGPRFPDMMRAYDRALNEVALDMALRLGFPASTGIYLALQGPSLETPAEYNFIHTIGADLVGMSTIPEVIVAKYLNLPVFAVSVVSNLCYPIEKLTETTVDEVIEVVKSAEPRVEKVVKELVKYCFMQKK